MQHQHAQCGSKCDEQHENVRLAKELFWRTAGASAVSNGLLNGLIDGLYDGLLDGRRIQWDHPWSWHRGRNMDGC